MPPRESAHVPAKQAAARRQEHASRKRARLPRSILRPMLATLIDAPFGVMAKRADGCYYSARRTREWLKIKTGNRQEVVIVGFTRPRRSRQYFGALALAMRKDDRWEYVGHTGTGFNAASLKTIYDRMQKLVTARKPVVGKVPNEGATTWVRPRLVGEVKFTEWTKDGRMRHPAFVGLRTDKPASKVVREYERHREPA